MAPLLGFNSKGKQSGEFGEVCRRFLGHDKSFALADPGKRSYLLGLQLDAFYGGLRCLSG